MTAQDGLREVEFMRRMSDIELAGKDHKLMQILNFHVSPLSASLKRS